MAKIEQQFPVWDHNPLESDALLIVRRSFHTLKGSGRMVNARALSEFAWAIENLLNRILDGTLQRSPAVLETLRSAVEVLPQLVAELEAGSPAAPTWRSWPRARTPGQRRDEPHRAAASARASADGARASAASASSLPTAAVPAGSRRRTPCRSETERRDRSCRAGSRRGLAGAIRRCARSTRARPRATSADGARAGSRASARAAAPHVLPEEVYRACHTLVGSSTMAEARHGIRLAEPLNHWLRKSFDSGVGLDDSDLLLLGDCMTAMESGRRPSR